MKTYNINIPLPKNVTHILKQLNDYGYESYVVGGAVRSYLIGIQPKDYDIVTNAKPNEIMEIFPKTKAVGEAFGVILVCIDNEQYEVATYRTEDMYKNGRCPEEVKFAKTIEEDSKRRDFTMNALYYDYRENIVIDFYNGIEDIKNKTIACVGDAIERFIYEDCLRMLRAVRFSSQLKFGIRNFEYFIIRQHSCHIIRISVERIQDELVKILKSPNCSYGIENLLNLCFLDKIIPELSICFDFPQYSDYHEENVGNHILQSLYNDTSQDTKNVEILNLSLLLHDIGKPYVCVFDEHRKAHYLKHEEVSANMAYDILKRLKFSNEIIEQVTLLIRLHDWAIPKTTKALRKLKVCLKSDEMYELWKMHKYQDVKSHSNYNNGRDNRLKSLNYLNELEALLSNKGECSKLSIMEIKGKDLLELGFVQGVELGKILKDCFEKINNEEIENEYVTLIEYVKANYKNKLFTSESEIK